MAAKQPDLLSAAQRINLRNNRRGRNLFLPKLLAETAPDYHLWGETEERAHAVLVRWADLETSGKLRRKTESNLEAEFMTEVFGDALGYTLFRNGEREWNLAFRFPVNSATADAAIGLFREGESRPPRAVIELKGPESDLDRDRSAGRTPVQQCWDYLNALPDCPWGIVLNYVSFRLYHRQQGTRAFQEFLLQDLRKKEVFAQFLYVFGRRGLLPTATQPAGADLLLERTGQRQQEVGDDLYDRYHQNRISLVDHLCGPAHGKSIEAAIHIAQKLLDRIVFVAFCEDRGLLPPDSLRKAHEKIPPFYQVTNPRWQNFLSLFRNIDEGLPEAGVDRYNGGLFRQDPEVDDLQLHDEWTLFFKEVGAYDFRDEVHLDVLGHLFEKSIGDLERLRVGGRFALATEKAAQARMQRSAERKRHGIYYTPRDFTRFIVERTVGDVVRERLRAVADRHGIRPQDAAADKSDPRLARYWRDCLDALRRVKVVDPACGSGAFLIRAYDLLEELYDDVVEHIIFHEGPKAEEVREQVSDIILGDNLFGVDLSPQAVEITQLALWIRSARKGRTLADLSKNVVCGNSLVSDPAVDPKALDWQLTFPQAFLREGAGFDCVIGNPPWERMKLQEREFFDAFEPRIAAAVNAAERRRLIANLPAENPDLFERYRQPKESAERTLDAVRNSGRFPLTGRGDINTYAAFAELASTLVAATGRVGLLVPSGIATDHTTREFFAGLIEGQRLWALYDFENRAGLFPDVHRSYKFCVLLLGGTQCRTEQADFVFFAHQMEELEEARRHITLTAKDFALFNPNTRTCPIFRSRRDAELTKAIYRRVPILVDHNRKEGGNPWGIRFLTMFHQTNDAELFHTAEKLQSMGFKRDGPNWRKGKQTFLPLYEAKMVQMYDHRAASVRVDPKNWMRQGQTEETSRVQHQNPEFCVEPRWWVEDEAVSELLGSRSKPAYLAYKDVTSPTNLRTMIAAFIPPAAAVNSAPLVQIDDAMPERLQCCLLANLNSFVMDYLARQKVGGVHLNFFIVEQVPMFPPDFYKDRCPWNKRQTLQRWISDRVLKLTCTSNDMRPLAEAAGFDPPVHKWKPDERAELMAELDAAFFLLYGIGREDVEYILSTFSGTRSPDPDLLDGVSASDRILRHYDELRKRSGA